MRHQEDAATTSPGGPSPADVEVLEILARAETAAVKSYTHALEALETESFVERVRPILAHHEEALAEVHRRLARSGSDAHEEELGFWGTMATALQRVAASMGERACLTILEEGEHHGVDLYRHTAGKAESAELRSWIEDHLEKNAKLHRGQLDALVWAMRHGADPRAEGA